jgi:hypothetical protein
MNKIKLTIFLITSFVIMLINAKPVSAQSCTDQVIECGTWDDGGNCAGGYGTDVISCDYYFGACHASSNPCAGAGYCVFDVSGCSQIGGDDGGGGEPYGSLTCASGTVLTQGPPALHLVEHAVKSSLIQVGLDNTNQFIVAHWENLLSFADSSRFPIYTEKTLKE